MLYWNCCNRTVKKISKNFWVKQVVEKIWTSRIMMFTMRNDQNAAEGKWSQVAAMCISPLVFWPGSQVTRQAALAEEERNKVCLVKLFGLSGWLETVFLSVVFSLLNPWNLFSGNVTLLNGKMEPIVHIWLEISYSFRAKSGWWGGRTRWTVVIGVGLHAFPVTAHVGTTWQTAMPKHSPKSSNLFMFQIPYGP